MGERRGGGGGRKPGRIKRAPAPFTTISQMDGATVPLGTDTDRARRCKENSVRLIRGREFWLHNLVFHKPFCS
jgi:hypothetical protein